MQNVLRLLDNCFAKYLPASCDRFMYAKRQDASVTATAQMLLPGFALQ